MKNFILLFLSAIILSASSIANFIENEDYVVDNRDKEEQDNDYVYLSDWSSTPTFSYVVSLSKALTPFTSSSLEILDFELPSYSYQFSIRVNEVILIVYRYQIISRAP